MNIFIIILSLVVIFVFVFLFLKNIEKKTIFFPVKNLGITPQYFNLPFELCYPEAADKVKLSGWFIRHPEAKSTLLFLHGNGGNISHRLHKASLLYRLGVNIFLLDYRGYGQSQGVPSVAGIYKDSQAALDFLNNVKKIEKRKIILYGESLGSAPATFLAANRQLGGLILEGAFSCGRDMAKLIFPCLPSFCISDIFRNQKYITRVKIPKLFIHSPGDEIVPIALARKLYQEAPWPKEFKEIVGGHNTSYIDSQDKYLQAIEFFLNKVNDKES